MPDFSEPTTPMLESAKMSLFLNLRNPCAEGFALRTCGRIAAISDTFPEHLQTISHCSRERAVRAPASCKRLRDAFNKRLQKRVCKSLILRVRVTAGNGGQETNDFRTQEHKFSCCPSVFS
jgi:hypothetical protein